MYNVLSQIGKAFNENNVLWGVGASVLLHQHGLVEQPNDIDLLVAEKDIKKADELLSALGSKKAYENTGDYATEYFLEYHIQGVDIDVMCNLGIVHDEGVFHYVFDDQSIDQHVLINGVKIPFCTMEDWYVIYQLLRNRMSKVQMVEAFLKENGVKHPYLLERALKGQLTERVYNKIVYLIGK